jgi:sensor histidine kinase YesM
MKITKLTRRQHLVHVFALSILVVFINHMQFGDSYWDDPVLFTIISIVNYTVTYLTAALLFHIMFKVRDRFPHYHQSLLRAVTLLCINGIITASTITTAFFLYDATHFMGFELIKAKLYWSLIAGLLFNTFYTVIFEFFYIEKSWGDDVREKEALQQANLVSQFESLKAQVNPHFLFNCLNSLSSLISQNTEKAENFVDEMSNVYRYLLRNNEQGLVTIESEIQYIRSYFHLQKTRFGDAIALTIQIEPEYLNCLIPPLTLQMLLENAVKHNTLRKTAPLYIEIQGKDGFLTVRNNIQKKNKEYIISTKIGLANIASKYKLINKSDIIINNDGKYFVVSLPLIPNDTYSSIDYKRQ